jgi:hypothetical protein
MAGSGIRLLWLKKNKPYYIDPDSRTFAMLSVTGVHTRMAKADFNRLTEEKLEEGTADCLESDGHGGYIITDYKVYGSYKVAKAVEADNKFTELKPETYQLNAYRIGFERAGFPISRMRLFMIARDGGTYISKKRKVTRNTAFVELPRLKNLEVELLYSNMKTAFEIAERERFAHICTAEQAWDGRRCNGYCDVAEHCLAIGDNLWITKTKGEVKK